MHIGLFTHNIALMQYLIRILQAAKGKY